MNASSTIQMTTEEAQTLVQKFGSEAESDDVKSECFNLMKQFSLSAEELFWKWESYILNRSGGSSDSNITVSFEELKRLQEYIMADLEKENQRSVKKPRLSMPQSVRKMNSPDDFLDSMMSTPGSRKRKAVMNGSAQQTPSRLHRQLGGHDTIGMSPQTPKVHPLVMTSSPAVGETPFRSRKEAGKIVETLNESVISIAKRDQVPENNITFQLNVDLKKYNFRTMRMKLTEVAEYFDDKIENMIETLKQSTDEIKDENIGNPAVMSQSEIIAVGRIISDQVEKLNSSSMLLETCRRIGAGMQVRLDVSQVKSFSFFPGQIVVLKGQNVDGNIFRVSELLEPQQLVTAASTIFDLNTIATRQMSTPASIVTAAGPYTTTDNLLYEPLDELISHINNTHPDVAILTGPFLDITHPLVQAGDYEVYGEDGTTVMDNATLDDLFRQVVSSKLNQISPQTTVIIIPSVRDSASSHAAFPQEPLDRRQLKLSKHVKCLSNPATFQLNEVVFAVNSIDVIRDLAATMYQHNPQHRGLFGAIHHVLSSKSMYPVFPAPQKFTDDGVETTGGAIDVPFMGLAEFTHAMPDVLITASLMKPLAEVSQNVVVINPGFCCKKTGGGTFATLTIKPPSPQPDLQPESLVSHEIWSRARVDIIKL